MQKMDSLLKASENFEQFDEKTFIEFMKRVTIWEYFGLSKESYLALPESEKRVKIHQYYFDMKSRTASGSGGEFSFCLIA